MDIAKLLHTFLTSYENTPEGINQLFTMLDTFVKDQYTHIKNHPHSLNHVSNRVTGLIVLSLWIRSNLDNPSIPEPVKESLSKNLQKINPFTKVFQDTSTFYKVCCLFSTLPETTKDLLLGSEPRLTVGTVCPNINPQQIVQRLLLYFQGHSEPDSPFLTMITQMLNPLTSGGVIMLQCLDPTVVKSDTSLPIPASDSSSVQLLPSNYLRSRLHTSLKTMLESKNMGEIQIISVILDGLNARIKEGESIHCSDALTTLQKYIGELEKAHTKDPVEITPSLLKDLEDILYEFLPLHKLKKEVSTHLQNILNFLPPEHPQEEVSLHYTKETIRASFSVTEPLLHALLKQSLYFDQRAEIPVLKKLLEITQKLSTFQDKTYRSVHRHIPYTTKPDPTEPLQGVYLRAFQSLASEFREAGTEYLAL